MPDRQKDGLLKLRLRRLPASEPIPCQIIKVPHLALGAYADAAHRVEPLSLYDRWCCW
jgi:hypothetical protein